MRKSKGYRAKTRHLMRKKPRDRGMQPVGRLLHEYAIGEKVRVDVDPSEHKGMPHRRFHGRVGLVAEKRGRGYVIEVKDGNAAKKIIIRPEHMKPAEA